MVKIRKYNFDDEALAELAARLRRYAAEVEDLAKVVDKTPSRSIYASYEQERRKALDAIEHWISEALILARSDIERAETRNTKQN